MSKSRNDGPPPPGYVCNRCSQPGHWIFACPTNADPDYEKRKVRQPLGIPPQYGGPFLGLIACTTPLVRQIPGRLVDQTRENLRRVVQGAPALERVYAAGPARAVFFHDIGRLVYSNRLGKWKTQGWADEARRVAAWLKSQGWEPGSRIAIMSKGKIQQLGTPDEVYNNPANVFVAGFIGSPPMNLLPAVTDGDTARGEGYVVPLAGSLGFWALSGHRRLRGLSRGLCRSHRSRQAPGREMRVLAGGWPWRWRPAAD